MDTGTWKDQSVSHERLTAPRHGGVDGRGGGIGIGKVGTNIQGEGSKDHIRREQGPY